jgi:hypothetical protein
MSHYFVTVGAIHVLFQTNLEFFKERLAMIARKLLRSKKKRLLSDETL